MIVDNEQWQLSALDLTPMSAFSNAGQDVIQTTITIDSTHTRNQDIETFYEIARTANEITNGDYKRVCKISTTIGPGSQAPFTL